MVRFSPVRCRLVPRPHEGAQYYIYSHLQVLRCRCRILHACARHFRAAKRDGSVTRPAAGQLQIRPVHLRCLRNVRPRRHVSLCSRRGRPAVRGHASQFVGAYRDLLLIPVPHRAHNGLMHTSSTVKCWSWRVCERWLNVFAGDLHSTEAQHCAGCWRRYAMAC